MKAIDFTLFTCLIVIEMNRENDLITSPIEVLYEEGGIEDSFDLAPYFRDIQDYDRDPNNYPYHVDFYADTDYLRKKLRALAGYFPQSQDPNTHVISAVNGMDKYSRYYSNCIGLVLMGKDKETKENISVLTHQDTYHSCVADDWVPGFKRDLILRVEEMIQQCKQDSISVSLFGGYLHPKKDDLYEEGIDFFIKFFLDKLDVYPQILAYPNKKGERLDVYLETQKGIISLFKATLPHLLTQVEGNSDMIGDFVAKRRLKFCEQLEEYK